MNLRFIIQVLIFFSLSLFFNSAFANLELVKIDGQYRISMPMGTNSNGVTTYRSLDGRIGHTVDLSKDTNTLRDTMRGIKSNPTRLPATVSRTVPTAKVAQNILDKLKVARLTPQGLVGGLILQEILNKLLEQGYTYDEASGNYVKQGAFLYCAVYSGACIDQNNKTFVSNKYAVYEMADQMPSHQEMQDKLCSQVTKEHFNFVDHSAIGDKTGCSLNARLDTLNVSFAVVKQIGFLKPGQILSLNMRVSRLDLGTAPLTADGVATVIIQMPGKEASIIEAAQLQDSDWSEPSVHVLDGTIVNSQPFTDTDGKAKQATWHFYDCSSGTCVREVLTDRPDLEPYSPAAPAAGNGTGIGTGSQTGTDGETPPPFDLCKEHPEILACQQMGQPDSGQFDDIKIPVAVDDTTWQEDVFLPSNGVCPAPKTFHVMGKPFEVSYQPLCSLMESIRFMVLIAFILMSAYVCFGSLRRE